MRVDYHIHTRHSDGVCSVEEIISKVREQNIRAFSVTDHDTIEGTELAGEICPPQIRYVPGVEFTCAQFTGKEPEIPVSVHLLGYGFDPGHPSLSAALQERKKKVDGIYRELMKSLQAKGVHIELEKIPISCGSLLQLSDVTDFMQKSGYILTPETEELIFTYNRRLTSANIAADTAVALIHEAGGRAVWAHPFKVYHDYNKLRLSREEVTVLLKYLREKGLDGVEADYLEFCTEEREWLRKQAEQYGLFCTAGSDFHGLPGRVAMGVEVEKDEMQ